MKIREWFNFIIIIIMSITTFWDEVSQSPRSPKNLTHIEQTYRDYLARSLKEDFTIYDPNSEEIFYRNWPFNENKLKKWKENLDILKEYGNTKIAAEKMISVWENDFVFHNIYDFDLNADECYELIKKAQWLDMLPSELIDSSLREWLENHDIGVLYLMKDFDQDLFNERIENHEEQ